MNTVKDLRKVLAEEQRRLQPPPGLESRILQQALRGSAARPSSGAAGNGSVGFWKSHRPARQTTGARALGVLAAVLVVVLIVVGILIGGRLLRDWGSIPAGPPTHAVPRADSGMVTSAAGWRTDTGPVQHTKDGGAHWTNVDPRPYVNSAGGDSAYFLDAAHAWVSETDGNGALDLTIYRTTDGAETWSHGAAISFVADGQLEPRLYFLDPTHGWLVLSIVTIGIPPSMTPNPDMIEDAIYGTSDGGLHWTFLARSLHRENAGCDWGRAAFTSLTEGWLGLDCLSSPTSQPVLATHDGGLTWTPLQLPLAGAGLSCPCTVGALTVFDPESAAILVQADTGPTFEQRLFMTLDQGESWTARTLPGEVQFTVDFIDSKHGWSVAGPSALFGRDPGGNFPVLSGVTVPLYRTDDGGLTWTAVKTNLLLSDNNGRLTDLYFVDLQHGFAERYYSPIVSRVQKQLLRTDDGGHSWKVVWTYA